MFLNDFIAAGHKDIIIKIKYVVCFKICVFPQTLNTRLAVTAVEPEGKKLFKHSFHVGNVSTQQIIASLPPFYV